MSASETTRVPSLLQGLWWAWRRGRQGGGVSRARLVWRAATATLMHGGALRRWMHVACELADRGLFADLPGEYLRAIRPYVNRHTSYNQRVVQLIEHADWLETAFQPKALERLAARQPVVLAELPPPRGYDFMRLQIESSPPQSPEGELLLTLTLQRSRDVQHKAVPVQAAALGFSHFRLDGTGCLVIGGVRGQRHPVHRVSSIEIGQAMSGWKPPVLMVRVAQELARAWDLRIVGLDPSSHRLQNWTYLWNARRREARTRIYESYDSLWDYFGATRGPTGWMVLPLDSDEKLAATALSPERRERQIRRADFWLRTRGTLRSQMREVLQRPGSQPRLTRVTQSMQPSQAQWDDPDEVVAVEDMVPSRISDTGPGRLA